MQAGPNEAGKVMVMEGAVPIRGPEGICKPFSSHLLLSCKKETGCQDLLWKVSVKAITGTDHFKLTEGGFD